LARDGRFIVYPAGIPGQPLQFFFNFRLSPTDDPAVRRALLAATDRAAIVRTVFGSWSPVALGPLTASTWGAAAVVPEDAFDREAAAEMLRSAGWQDADGDGIREKDGGKLRLKVVYPPWGMTPQAAELLELQWKDAGAAVELIQVASYSALMDAYSGGGYHLIAWNQAGTDPDMLRQFFRSDGAYNLSGMKNAEVDSLLDEAVRSGNDSERLNVYRSIQEIIARECAVLPIRDYVNVNVAGSRVKGLHFSPQGWFPVLIDVSLD
jgi:peptide/nickel transport system substrate-binding protein